MATEKSSNYGEAARGLGLLRFPPRIRPRDLR